MAVIGFILDNYTVAEGIHGLANLTVEVTSGQLGREVVVIVDIHSNGSATSE